MKSRDNEDRARARGSGLQGLGRGRVATGQPEGSLGPSAFS